MKILNKSRFDVSQGFKEDYDYIIQIEGINGNEFLELPYFEKSLKLRFDEYHYIPMSDCIKIIEFLQDAVQNNKNVLVHCSAGIMRSGAIVEFAVKFLEFTTIDKYREPDRMTFERLWCMFDELSNEYYINSDEYKNIIENLF